MRSVAELLFRGNQELGNLYFWLRPPRLVVERNVPDVALPNPHLVVERLRGTRFQADIERLAKLISGHQTPLWDQVVSLGERIEWRRDYIHQITSGTRYFRLVPYLDFTRVGDHKAIWDLNRHQHLVVLAQAFLFTARETYLLEIQNQLESWFDQNPYMRGINWTSALEVAFRGLSWIWLYHFIGKALTNNIRRKLITGLYQHGCYLEHNLSIYFSPNTHLLGEAVCLHALGTLFPHFPRAERWRTVGGTLTAAQMESQVRQDGSHFEQSAYYHLYALDFFLFHQVLAETSPGFQAKLRRMADYLSALMGSARRLPLIGDDDGGRVFHPYGRCEHFARATLATCALVFEGANWPYEESDLYEQAAWWLGAQVLGRTSSSIQSANPESRLFRDSGLIVMNSSSVQVLFDAGPFGSANGGHSHSDTLSLVVRGTFEEILADSGTYTYVADAILREWFRSSTAHNTVRIDGTDQAMPGTPFRWTKLPDVEVLNWITNADHDIADAVCRYHGQLEDRASTPGSLLKYFVHRRTVLLLKPQSRVATNVLIVCDRLNGPGGRHIVEQFWHPGEALDRLAATHYRIGKRGYLVIPNGTEFESVNHWRSRCFGEKSSAPALMVRRETAVPVTMWAALLIGESQESGLLRVSESDADRATLECGHGRNVNIAIDASGFSFSVT